MAKFQLSEGALHKICQGATVDKPVFQLLSTKRIAGTSSERYRLLISDGRNSNSYGMLATQLNFMIHQEKLQEHAILRVNKHHCNDMQGKKVIILLELEVLQPGPDVGQKIGEPVPLNADGSLPPGADQNKPMNKQPDKRPGDEGLKGQPAAKKPHGRPSLLDAPTQFQGSQIGAIFPIASLTPYQNKWTIKARVTHKSDIRRWSNARGEGHLFSMDLLDESGEIRATAFKDQCDRFYNSTEVGKVYMISNCSLKPANKQYSTLNNDYELTFRDNAEMVPCDDDDAGKIPTVTFNFVKLDQLTPGHKDTIIDVLGVCKSSNDVATITSQRTGKELRKRDITLVDKSLTEIGLTLWGSNAENFNGEGNPVIAIKGAKVSDFSGVSLSTLSSSTIQVNPEMSEAFVLKGWYDGEGSTASFNSLTVGRGAGGADYGSGSNLRSLGEVKAENLGFGSDRGEYYSTLATIIMFQKEKALYKACSQPGLDGKGCNKKVQDLGNDRYRCEKCNIEMDYFRWRMILSFNIADATDNQWVTCFQEEGEKILGKSAEDLGMYQENDVDEFNKAFHLATFKKFNFRLRCKADNYNDEQRVRHTIMSASKLDYKEYNKRIIQEIKDSKEELPNEVDLSKYV